MFGGSARELGPGASHAAVNLRAGWSATRGMRKGPPVVTGFAALLLLACSGEETSLVARHIGVPDERTCVFEPDASGAFRARGVLDVALSPVYSAFVLVANQLTPRGDKQNLRSETSGIVLEGAVVELETAGGELLDAFTVPTSGFVDGASGEAPGFGSAFVTLIPEQHGTELRESQGSRATETRIARVRVFGRTVGGVTVESTELAFPIVICWGCLIDWSSADGSGSCGATAGEELGDAPCFPGQDEPTDCRRCTAIPACTSRPDSEARAEAEAAGRVNRTGFR